MNNSIKGVLIDYHKKQTLKNLLREDYETTPHEVKEHYLSFLNTEIENNIERMLSEYVKDEISNNRGLNKEIIWLCSSINAILSAAVGYFMSEESWITSIIFILLLGTNNRILHHFNK